jgi:hypothetical protein
MFILLGTEHYADKYNKLSANVSDRDQSALY